MDETTCQRPVRGAWAQADNAREAVRRLRHKYSDSGKAALTLLFCASGLNREELAAALQEHFEDQQPYLACTTAGEITPEGARDGSVTALQFDATDFRAAVGAIEDVHGLGIDDATRLIGSLRADLDRQPPLPTAGTAPEHEVAILVVDGLSTGEEVLLANLTPGLGATPLIGGSASDGLRFEQTGISVGGAFQSGGAALALLRTSLPMVTFKTESFVLGEQRIVVTAATPGTRTVHEFNGRPAIDEYARILGVPKEQLTPEVFAQHPLAIRVAGVPHVRSIRQPLADGGLEFYCAMDEGLVLHDVHAIDLVNDTRRAFARLRDSFGEPLAVLAFDCIQRRLETERLGRADELDRLFREHRAVGFRTYGEQFGRTHVNCTLSALAFGSAPAPHGES